MSYRTIITNCIQEHRARHTAIHATFAQRDTSPAHYVRWEEACAAFRKAENQMLDLLVRCLKDGLEQDLELRQFAFQYIDEDPYYFRSGYMLGALLQRVKRLELTQAEVVVLQHLVLRRIDTQALREFRRICRLIPRVHDPAFQAQLITRAKEAAPDIARRAEFALGYVPDQNGQLPVGSAGR
ncbi:MAG: hypothetical protein AB8B82_05105 [Roseovarius sp.]